MSTLAQNASHPPLYPPWLGWLLLLALAGGAILAGRWMRQGALRAWKAFAKELDGGEFAAKNAFSPHYVNGKVGERDFMLTTALSYEDDAPYYHTCAAVPITNPASLILGLRRKSLLEEAQTRRETPGYENLEDPEFVRQFFLVCNVPQLLPDILTSDIRKELRRYGDVEVYGRLNRLEWRRSGEVSDLRALRRLTDALGRMADAIDALPSRRLTLSERLADEAVIEKGV